MQNRIKSSAEPSSWLAALARRLRDWLNHYLDEDVVEDGRAESARERENDAAPSPRQERLDPLEHWLDLVREAAPELLIAPEEGGTPWLYAGQVQDEGISDEVRLPENQAPAETSGPISALPLGLQQAKGKMSPRVDRQRTTNEPADGKTNAALSRTEKRRGHAGSISPADITTNEATQSQQPLLQSMFERKEAGRRMDRMTEDISPSKELPVQAALQPDAEKETGRQMDRMTEDVPSKELPIRAALQPGAQPAAPSGFHNVPHTRSAMEHGEAPVPHSEGFTTLRAPLRTAHRAPDLVRGPNRNEAVERERDVKLDSAAAALNGQQVVANQPSSQKQQPSSSLQVKPMVRPPGFNEAGTWPALPTSEQHGIDLLPPAQPRPANAKSTGDRWAFFTGSARDIPMPVSNLKAEGIPDLWPELPEGPPLEDVDDAQVFRDLKHVQALDLEQGGY